MQANVIDWTGHYYCGDGLGFNCSLELDHDGRFAFLWEGCMGTYGKHAGDYARTGDTLTLVIDGQAPDKLPLGSLMLAISIDWMRQVQRDAREALQLIPMRWGERKYLVPRPAMREFVNAVNLGTEPRAGVHGYYMLLTPRQDGWKLDRPAGLPELGPEWAGRLLPAPIEARVVAHDPDTRLATIDGGGSDGLFEGMELCLLKDDGSYHGKLQVGSVQEHTARFEAGPDPAGMLGKRVSSRLPASYWGPTG